MRNRRFTCKTPAQTVVIFSTKEAINTSAEFKVTYKYLIYVLVPIYYRLLHDNKYD